MYHSESMGSTAAAVELSTRSFRPPRTVLATQVRDGVILLDRISERYLTLNRVAGQIWEQLAAGATPAAIVDWLCAEYDVPCEQVAIDVAAQVEEFLRNGLVEPGTAVEGDPFGATRSAGGLVSSSSADLRATPVSSAASVDAPLPSYLRCALLIAEVKLRLGARGYDHSLLWIQRQVEHVPATEQAGMDTVRAAEYRVAMTAALYPGRAKCLEQSLALYCLLRRQGIGVRYYQGVRPYPFQAHAWVEYRGEVINDVPEHVAQFTRFPDQLP